MENRQNKPPKGGAASGHGGQKFHTDSEQAKLHKSKPVSYTHLTLPTNSRV